MASRNMTAISFRSDSALPYDEGGAVPTVPLLGLDFANLSLDTVLERLAARAPGVPFGYVVTPNSDHLVRLHRRPDLRPLYTEALLRLLDSRVVARAARIVGLSAPAVVPGSDLTARVVQEVLRV